MEEIIRQKRIPLTESIRTGDDPTESILGLIDIKCPLNQKFAKIKGFSELLIKNSETSDSIRRLLMMLNILEKYGKHLLKPADQRSSMWRHIKNSNSIYRDRVATIWGGPLVMKMMGYTEDRADGVAFPEGSEPDHPMLLELVGDIILGRKELEMYLAGTHPYPSVIEEHLNKEILTVLKPGIGSSDKDVNTSALPGGTQASRSLASGVPTAQFSTQLPTTPGSYQQRSAPGQPPEIKTTEHTNMVNSEYNQLLQELSGAGFNSLQVNLPQQSGDVDVQNENRTPSIVCDICGKNQANIICQICDSKQLCVDCDSKWHSHPKRQNHQRQRLGQPLGPAPQPCGTGAGQGQRPEQQTRGVLGELSQGGDNTYSPPGQQRTPPPSTHQNLYQPLIRPGTGPSMMYEPMVYGQIPSSSGAHIPHSPLMYQPQYPPQPISNQVRWLPSMWTSSQPGSGQYFFPNQMMGSGQVPRSSHMTSPSHMTGQNHILDVQARVGQSMQYPYSLAGGLRENQEVRGSFPGGYTADMNQAHTLAYIPNTYARGTSSQVSADMYSQQGQGELSSPGNQIRPESPNTYQTKQKNIEENYETLAKTDTLRRTASQLVLKLQAIPDLEKRRARLDINIATLKEDVEELDEKINLIIVENENFIQDPDYNKLSKQKQKCLRDIKELEIYEQELDKMIGENPEEGVIENGRNVLQVQGGMKQVPGSQLRMQSMDKVTFPPSTVIPPNIGSHSVFVANQNTENNHVQKGKNVPADITGNEEEENLKNVEEERRMNEIRKMLVLGQNPFGPTCAKQEPLGLNIPVSEDGNEIIQKPLASEDVTYPPQITVSAVPSMQSQQKAAEFSQKLSEALKVNINIPQQGSEPKLAAAGDESEQIRKAPSVSDLQWQCEHCTFVNDHDNNICTICCKTNANKKRISMGSGEKGPGPDAGAPEGMEACKKCTFHNEKGQDKCQMCGETLILDKAPKPMEKSDLAAPNAKGTAQGKKEAVSPRMSSLEQKLEEEQDQVFNEKKKAQQKFKEEQEAAAVKPPNVGAGKKVERTASTGVDESSFVFVEQGSSLLLNEGVPLEQNYVGKMKNKKIASLQKSPQTSPPSSNEEFFFTPPTSMMEPCPSLVAGRLTDRRPPANVNFNEAIEQIQMRRAQEQMSLDGHDYVMLLKAAEKEGYTLDEVEIAATHCVDEKLKPIDWLKQKWEEQIGAVIDMVSQIASQSDDVGELSKAEAKAELIRCKGDIKKAADACVKSRKEKFKEISSDEDCSREKILTALFQNEGDVEATIDQLNSYVVKGLSEHVWVEPNANCGEGAEGCERNLVRAEGGAQGLPLVGAGPGAVGGLGSEVSDGLGDSIIASEGYQVMIKDKAIDRERRIRTILVEGKLQSWGRAETVIIILDKEYQQLEDVVECSLDDIIEAVKNCGDRKRSLTYLRQECGICFSCYPMNKILNLNSCQCKLCKHCLKQNFEVAIREKYVRYWVCPLCQAPNLEDEVAASAYFEFLQLLLRTLVDDEVKDLFETKLRDWHLQKEVNFRWCAHCASGFVWDRPDVMGMTCPACHKKTCFMCKKKWENQHQGLTCEEFTQWKIDNDPTFQAVGLARHLEENGIDCPSCKMRYDLAKGGCMHFRCPQCGHEFCSGCSEPFMQDGTCKLTKDCKGKGLHCHHPRDCFYYLRDNDVADLQALLKQNKVEYNFEAPSTQKDPRHCPVMEQKEYGADKRDEACGKDTQKGMAGLCMTHYKEYLVGLINKNKVDPVDIMGVKELERCYARMGKQAPKLNKNENEQQFKQRLAKHVRESFPLRR